MTAKTKRTVREPLVLFFLLGAVVFGLHAGLKKAPKQDQDERYVVEVTSADIEWLRTRWNKLMGREPTGKELQGLVDSLIREEILYREAVAMGLDEKDTVVRRRLAQKMEFLFKDLAEAERPSEEQLRKYFAAHQERYGVPARVSFRHVFFSSDKRGDKTEEDTRAALEELAAGKVDGSETSMPGDQFMLPSGYEQESFEQVGRTFGDEFARGVSALKVGEWDGPVRSSYGWHVVYVHERTEASMPSFDEVRAKVEVDYVAGRKAEVNNRAYREISSRYQVLVEDLPYESGEK